MKTRFLITIAFCAFAYFANSQNMQVYNGDFTLKDVGANGTAKYSYYENENYERIYNGDFSFSWEKDYSTIDISGKFNKNLRDGKWTFKVHYGHPYNADYLVIANYKDGMPNGEWTSTLKKKEKLMMSDKRYFSNGLLIDTWTYENFDRGNKLVMKLDKEGFIIESDYIELGTNQILRKYEFGYCILTVRKKVQSGESNVEKVDDPEILTSLSNIQRYMAIAPDSLQDLPYALEKISVEYMWDNFFDTPYDLTFTKDIHGWVKCNNGKQFYGIYERNLRKQKTREQIRQEKEIKMEEEKRERIAVEKEKIYDLKIIDNNLYQSINADILTNCEVFLKKCIIDKKSTSFNFSISAKLAWSPTELEQLTYTQDVEWFLVPNATNYLYCSPKYSIAKNKLPVSVQQVFETNKLANIEKEFEGELIIMKTFVEIEAIKLEYVTGNVNIKLSKNKEIIYETEMPENYKNIIADKIKMLEKGKYSLNYQIGFLNEIVVDTAIEQVK